MFKEGLGIKKAYIACGYTDLRYGVDGLAALIQYQFSLDPFDEGTMFLFCGRRADGRETVLSFCTKDCRTEDSAGQDQKRK